MNECTIRTSLRRLEKRGLITKKLLRPPRALTGRRLLHYQASTNASLIHEKGTLPGSSQVQEVVVTPLKDSLDASRIKYERRKARVRFDKYDTKVLRVVCGPYNKSDPAKQVTYSDREFNILIPESGKSTLRPKSEAWADSFRQWMLETGLGPEVVENYVLEAIASMRAERVEVFVKDPRLAKRIHRVIIQYRDANGNLVLSTDVNQSMNELGIEARGEYADSWVRSIATSGSEHSLLRLWLDKLLEKLEDKI